MSTEQRRGRKIAMTTEELDAFLAGARTCRLATSSPQGPHLTALWFAWDGTALWIYSIVRSQRWTDLERDGRVAVLVDAGEEYGELRGAELRGTVEFVGAAPWTGAPDPPPAEAARRQGPGGCLPGSTPGPHRRRTPAGSTPGSGWAPTRSPGGTSGSCRASKCAP